MNTRNVVTALALSVSLVASVPAFSAVFQDVQGHWAQPSIEKLSSQNILGGYPDGTFKPEGTITRAEFAAVLVKAAGLTTPASYGQSFQDVPSSHWAYSAIEQVKAKGLVSGYPGGYYYPNKNINRSEALSILVNAANIPLLDEAAANQVLSRFQDAYSIPAWARRSVATAVQNGFVANLPNAQYLYPIQSATRADVASMTTQYRAYEFNQGNLQMPQQLGQAPQQTQPGQQMANNPPMGASGNMLHGHVMNVPAGTEFTGTVQTGLNSDTSRVGDTVRITLDVPLVNESGVTVVPVGSTIEGTLRNVEPRGRAGKNGMLDIAFNSIVLPNGQRYPLAAKIATEDGLLKGGSAKGRALKAVGKTALGAGAGAVAGTALGALSGGKVGKGAVYGTAVGAGVGAATAAVQKGQAAVVEPGERLEIELQSPLTVDQSAQSRMPQQPGYMPNTTGQ